MESNGQFLHKGFTMSGRITALLFQVLFLWTTACSSFIQSGARTATPNPVDPRPGEILYGIIIMGTLQDSPSLSLTVSNDGRSVLLFTINFLNLQENREFINRTSSFAEACVAAYSFTFPSATSIPVKDGSFSTEGAIFGSLDGYFNSPTSARGTIHLYPDNGPDCSVWEWFAEAAEE